MISGLVRWCRSKFRKTALMSPGEFTQFFADFLARNGGGIEVSVVGDLRLKVGPAEDNDRETYLHNAYQAYARFPDEVEKIVAHFGATALDVLNCDHKVDRTRIVPVVKDRAWWEDSVKAIVEQGGEEPKAPIYDEFARDLVILYAVDSELSVFYMNQEHMEELNMPREELRTLALANLRRLLPDIERVGAGGLFLFRAGGTYESSLLLLDTIWAGVQAEVQGAPVAVIPTRDCLLVCGADNKEHLAKLKAMAQMAWKSGPYSLTPTPFIYRNDRFLPFEE